jgi:hypothetical protein
MTDEQMDMKPSAIKRLNALEGGDVALLLDELMTHNSRHVEAWACDGITWPADRLERAVMAGAGFSWRPFPGLAWHGLWSWQKVTGPGGDVTWRLRMSEGVV